MQSPFQPALCPTEHRAISNKNKTLSARGQALSNTSLSPEHIQEQAHTHTHTHSHTYSHKETYTEIHTDTHSQSHTLSLTHTHIHTHTHTHILSLSQTHTHAHIYAYYKRKPLSFYQLKHFSPLKCHHPDNKTQKMSQLKKKRLFFTSGHALSDCLCAVWVAGEREAVLSATLTAHWPRSLPRLCSGLQS